MEAEQEGGINKSVSFVGPIRPPHSGSSTGPTETAVRTDGTGKGWGEKLEGFRAGDQRIAMVNRINKLHFCLADHLGSTRMVIDSAGVAQWASAGYAFPISDHRFVIISS